MTTEVQMPRRGRRVKNRWAPSEESAAINIQVARDVKLAAQVVARREGKSLSLWLEEVLRSELELPPEKAGPRVAA